MGLPRIILADLLLGAVLTVAAGCDDRGNPGGSDGGAGMGGAGGAAPMVPLVVTGIPGETPLASLTPEQRQILCEKTAEFAEAALASSAVRAGVCRLLAVIAATSAAPELRAEVCAETLVACVAQASGASIDGGVPNMCAAPGAVPSDCDVTIAQYEACLNSVPGGLAALDRVLPACNALSSDAGIFDPTLLAVLLSPACTAVATSCGGGVPGLPGAFSVPVYPLGT